MRKMNFVLAAFAVAFVWMIQSCEKEGGNRTNISQAGGTSSHKMGQNCMNCHVSGGEGAGWFNAAGTVYNFNSTNSYANPVVQLYTQPNGGGQLVKTIYGDAKGNAYTTESINFGTGLYAAVTGATGTMYMTDSIPQGACNSCHGVSTLRLYAY